MGKKRGAGITFGNRKIFGKSLKYSLFGAVRTGIFGTNGTDYFEGCRDKLNSVCALLTDLFVVCTTARTDFILFSNISKNLFYREILGKGITICIAFWTISLPNLRRYFYRFFLPFSERPLPKINASKLAILLVKRAI